MNIRIKSTQIELTDPLKDYIQKRLSQVEKILTSFEQEKELILDVEVARTTRHHHKGEVYYVELMMVVDGHTLRVEQTDEDMRAAVDEAKDRLKVEARRFKEKMQEKRS